MKLLEDFQSFIQSALISQTPFATMAYGANPKRKKKKKAQSSSKSSSKSSKSKL
jgi:hypothetical protein